MKKVFKLISLFILLLIVNVGVVNAANNKCGNVTIASGLKDNVEDENGNSISFGGFPLYSYSFRINNQTEVTAYCHNPGIHDYKDSDKKGADPVTMQCAS